MINEFTILFRQLTSKFLSQNQRVSRLKHCIVLPFNGSQTTDKIWLKVDWYNVNGGKPYRATLETTRYWASGSWKIFSCVLGVRGKKRNKNVWKSEKYLKIFLKKCTYCAWTDRHDYHVLNVFHRSSINSSTWMELKAVMKDVKNFFRTNLAVDVRLTIANCVALIDEL